MGALVLSELTRQLAAARALTDAEVRQAVAVLVDEAVPAEPKAEFLIQLARKGETVAEITAFARELRRRSRQPVLGADLRDRPLLDVVGTGGAVWPRNPWSCAAVRPLTRRYTPEALVSWASPYKGVPRVITWRTCSGVVRASSRA